MVELQVTWVTPHIPSPPLPSLTSMSPSRRRPIRRASSSCDPTTRTRWRPKRWKCPRRPTSCRHCRRSSTRRRTTRRPNASRRSRPASTRSVSARSTPRSARCASARMSTPSRLSLLGPAPSPTPFPPHTPPPPLQVHQAVEAQRRPLQRDLEAARANLRDEAREGRHPAQGVGGVESVPRLAAGADARDLAAPPRGRASQSSSTTGSSAHAKQEAILVLRTEEVVAVQRRLREQRVRRGTARGGRDTKGISASTPGGGGGGSARRRVARRARRRWRRRSKASLTTAARACARGRRARAHRPAAPRRPCRDAARDRKALLEPVTTQRRARSTTRSSRSRRSSR